MLRFAPSLALALALTSPAHAQAPVCRSITTVAPGDSHTHLDLGPRALTQTRSTDDGVHIAVYDTTASAPPRELTIRVGAPGASALGPSGTLVVLSEPTPGAPHGDVALVDHASGAEIARRRVDGLGIGGFVEARFSPDGSGLVVWGAEGIAWLDARTLADGARVSSSTVLPGGHGIAYLAPASGGRAVVCGETGDGAARHGQVVIIDGASGARTNTMRVDHCSEILASDDGLYVTTAVADDSHAVIDVVRGRVATRVRGGRAAVRGGQVIVTTQGMDGFALEVRSLRGARVLSREEPFSESGCFSSQPPSRDGDDLVFFVLGSPSRVTRMALR